MAKQGKERIIAAAFHLFLKNGYKGVSLKDIIEHSALSKGAIYHHFDSKYAIYLASLEEYYFKLIGFDFPDDENLGLKERLRMRFELFTDIIAYIEYSGPSGIPFPIRAYFIFQLESEKDDFILKKVKESVDDYRSEVIKLIQASMDKNELLSDSPAQIIAFQMMTMIEGLLIHHSAVEKNCKAFLMEQFDEVISAYLDTILISETTNH